MENGWTKEKIDKTHSLRRFLRKLSKKNGIKFYDWSSVVRNFMRTEKSIFSRFALYADHCHLSSLGNQLMANELLADIKE
jgi:lysophospholipase L1-like esterase